jgi:phosphorylcholine metabolism protein LicD
MRIFTDKELELRNKGLKEIKQILEKINLPFFLVGGVLLGAVRDKNFIKWDWDVEISVFSEIAIKRISEIVNLSNESGFKTTIVNPGSKNLKIKLIKYDNKYSIEGLYIKKEYRLRKDYKYPAKFFTDLTTINFLGEDYLAPSPTSEFLTFVYGPDWMTPKKTLIKEDYLGEDHFNRTFYAKLKTILSKKIKEFLS